MAKPTYMIEGGYGVPSAPIEAIHGIYRTAVVYDWQRPPTSMFFGTNGTFHSAAVPGFQTKALIGTANILYMPKPARGGQLTKEVNSMIDRLHHDLFDEPSAKAFDETDQHFNLNDYKVQTKPRTPLHGVGIYKYGSGVEISFTDDWFSLAMTRVQTDLTTLSWKTKSQGYIYAGYGLMESPVWLGERNVKFTRPTMHTKFGADQRMTMLQSVDPLIPAKVRLMLPYIAYVAALLQDFFSDDKGAQEYLFPGQSQADWYVLADMLIMAFNGVSKEPIKGDLNKQFTALDIWESIRRFIGQGLTQANPFPFTSANTWKKYIVLMIGLGFAVNRINPIVEQFEFFRSRGPGLMTADQIERSFRPYTTALGSGDDPFFPTATNELHKGFWFPCAIDQDSTELNKLSYPPKLADSINFNRQPVSHGEWVSTDVVKTLPSVDNIVLPIFIPDVRQRAVTYLSRTTFEVKILNPEAYYGPEVDEFTRKWEWLLQMFSDRENALKNGYMMNYNGFIRVPDNIKYTIDWTGEMNVNTSNNGAVQQRPIIAKNMSPTGPTTTSQPLASGAYQPPKNIREGDLGPTPKVPGTKGPGDLGATVSEAAAIGDDSS